MKILSFKPGHDGQICLLADGKLEFSIEAEKDSWPRYEVVTPHLVMQAMERTSSLPDVFALSGWVKGFHSIAPAAEGAYFGWDESCKTVSERTLFGKRVKFFSSSHERSHIFCSFGLSPFPQGESFYALIWEGNIGSFYRVDEEMRVRHLGQVLEDPGNKYAYLYALADPGFPDGKGAFRFEDAGKLMALCSYGKPGAVSAVEQAVINRILDQKSILLELDKAEFKGSPYYNVGVESEAFKNLARHHSDAIFQRFHRFARKRLKEGLSLVIGGGCGLNCDWNSAWKKSGLFADVFVPPCTNDSGSAIGTAIEAQFEFTGSAKVDWSVYCGEEFVWDIPLPSEVAAAPLDLRELAQRLARGEIIAWVQGRCEMGPRALGNRSLLAAPFTGQTHARLNQIKHREGFRPIAPICLGEEVDRLFDHDGPSPHMLYFQRVRTDALRAVTHVDGSARLQSVNRSENQPIYDLLRAFKEHTGYGVLCNTSLNFKSCGFINRLSDLHAYAVAAGLDGYAVGDRFFSTNGSKQKAGQP